MDPKDKQTPAPEPRTTPLTPDQERRLDAIFEAARRTPPDNGIKSITEYIALG